MDLLYIGHIGLKGSRRISNEQVVKKITHCQDIICEMQLSLGKLNSLTPETPRSAVPCGPRFRVNHVGGSPEGDVFLYAAASLIIFIIHEARQL